VVVSCLRLQNFPVGKLVSLTPGIKGLVAIHSRRRSSLLNICLFFNLFIVFGCMHSVLERRKGIIQKGLPSNKKLQKGQLAASQQIWGSGVLYTVQQPGNPARGEQIHFGDMTRYHDSAFTQRRDMILGDWCSQLMPVCLYGNPYFLTYFF